MVHMYKYICMYVYYYHGSNVHIILMKATIIINTSKGYIKYLILISGMQAKEHPMILNPLIVILKYLINRVWELEPTTEALYNRCDYA